MNSERSKPGAESSLKFLERKEWHRLRKQLKMAEGFWLGFFFTTSVSAEPLRQQTKRVLKEQGRTLRLILPRSPDKLFEVLSGLFDEDLSRAGCVWLEALEVDSSEVDQDEIGSWTHAWDNLLLRLNERRERLRRHLSGGLVVVAPSRLKPRFRDAAPDLWSSRSLVLEPAMFVSVSEMEEAMAEAEALLTKDASEAASLAAQLVEVLAQGSDEEGKDLWARGLVVLARTLAADDDFPAATEHVKRALRLSSTRVPLKWLTLRLSFARQSGNLDHMRQAATSVLERIREPKNDGRAPQELRDLAAQLDELGMALYKTGQLAEAREVFENNLPLRRQVLEAYDGIPLVLQDVCESLEHLGGVLTATGERGRAQAAYRESLEYRRELVSKTGESPGSLQDLFATLKMLSRLERALGNRQEADSLYEQSVSIQATLKDSQAPRLFTQLEDLYARREQLTLVAEDTRALDGEILDVRRLLRKGPQLQSGEFLLDGRYRLVETLGKGGFATVWKAYDRQRKELVAVKILHGQHSEERMRRERFFRGARKMAELIHPNIVRVLETKLDDDGWLFFVMELVTGGDFCQAVLAGKLTDEEKLTIVSQVGKVLEFAHQQGVIHRDVKPGNVLLDGNGVAKLTDFDLVRAEDSTGFTQTRAMLGTLNYAAPEALDAPKDAGPPADVYSLASTTVFALLGGELPRGYYRDPSSTIAGLACSPALVQVLTQATAVDPGQRFASAGAFVAAVEEAAVVVEPRPRERALPKGRDAQDDELFSSFRTPQDGLKPLWCEIPAGVGWIGSPDSEQGRDGDEGPRHQVEVVRPFWLSAVPVTNAQYAAFDAKEPLYKWQGVPKDQLESHPRVAVSWEKAMSFCSWLSERGFQGARLPTEEEWEYACRAGSETAYWNGASEEVLAKAGWYRKNAGDRTHRVGEKPANPWGLYDVHGNVWEWTASVWNAKKYPQRPKERLVTDSVAQSADLAAPPGVRVVRGGSYWNTASRSRAAIRNFGDSESELGYQGFRVLLPFAPS
jgi:formylglycine-generating enzyme required for sulfatase activity/tetratricopeptide (TPR) repeat protein